MKQRFIQELRTTYKSGGLACALSEAQLTEFHNYLEKSFPHSDLSRVQKGVVCVGKQPNSTVWVVSPEVHINSSGELIAVRSYAWQPIGGPNIELTQGRNQVVSSISISSNTTLPLESSHALNLLLDSMKSVLKHNFISGGHS